MIWTHNTRDGGATELNLICLLSKYKKILIHQRPLVLTPLCDLNVPRKSAVCWMKKRLERKRQVLRAIAGWQYYNFVLNFLQIVIPPRCKFLHSHRVGSRAVRCSAVWSGEEWKDRDKHIVGLK